MRNTETAGESARDILLPRAHDLLLRSSFGQAHVSRAPVEESGAACYLVGTREGSGIDEEAEMLARLARALVMVLAVIGLAAVAVAVWLTANGASARPTPGRL